jgi:hypothetical protein
MLVQEQVPRKIQPKLALSMPGETTEAEADRIADKVMRTNLAKGSFPPVRKYPTVFRIQGSS